MGLSKSTRISILLGIDAAFFLLELIVGQYVDTAFPGLSNLGAQVMPFTRSLSLQTRSTWFVYRHVLSMVCRLM